MAQHLQTPIQLPPMQQQIGVFDNFVARQTETIILKEKVLSLTGDSFDIKLANGTPILRVQGKLASISGRKSVFDMANNHLFDIVKEHLHIHSTFVCENPQGQKFFEVKSSFALFGSKATATFTTPRTGKAQVLQMKGNWLDSYADIIDTSNNAVVARIDRKLLSGRDIFFGQQTYAVEIAPGVDMALMAAMCIALDEKNNEGGGSFF